MSQTHLSTHINPIELALSPDPSFKPIPRPKTQLKFKTLNLAPLPLAEHSPYTTSHGRTLDWTCLDCLTSP